MADIVQVKGKVRYKITLDPSVWIFDDRIIDLDTYFTEPKRTEQEVDEEKKLAESWGRELKEGAAPHSQKSKKQNFRKKSCYPVPSGSRSLLSWTTLNRKREVER